MPAKTRRNAAGIDGAEHLTSEQSAARRAPKTRSLWTSSWRNGQTSGSKGRKPEGSSKLSKGVKEALKLFAYQKALHDAVEKEFKAEEEHYGSLPDRVDPCTAFQETQFGDLVTRDRVSGDFPCSVVSLALFDGDTMLFVCSGIPLPRGTNKLYLTRYVTSARFAKEYVGHIHRDDKLKIQVRLPNDKRVHGLLELYNQEIAIVTSLDIQTVRPLDLELQAGPLPSDGEMLAAGRAFESGCLMAANVKLVSGNEDMPIPGHLSSWVTINTYEGGPTAVLGGPVVGKDNKIIGMSIDEVGLRGICISEDHVQRKVYVSFVPLATLYGYFKHFRILNPEVHSRGFRGYSLPEGVSTIFPSGYMRRIYRLKHLGYPMPPPLVLQLNGELRNQFEECFGDVRAWKGYPFGDPDHYTYEPVWVHLRNDVVKNISRRVVSIASFHGYERYFACTGLLIKWHQCTVVLTSASLVRSCHNEDEIDNALTIEVFLPPNQRASGKLELYNLNYNIAIVSLDKKFKAICPEDIMRKDSMPKATGEVVAVARGPQRGLLMASMGEVKRRDKGCKLDCKDLKLSTCMTKKAAIGGPLINFDGSFIGMNFFDERMLTPFLPRSKIVQVLETNYVSILPSARRDYVPVHLIADTDGESRKNRWPVPEPYWFHGLLDVDRYDFSRFRGFQLQ